MGSVLHKAREVLKKYKDGAFTRWLELAYGNRQTPYRMLQYYDFYQTLSKDVQPLIQSMPKRATHVLASRNGDPEKKVEIIKQHYASSSEDIIKIIQDTLPINAKDGRKRKDNDDVLVGAIRASF